MNSYVSLTIAAILPVIVAIVFYVLNKKPVFDGANNKSKALWLANKFNFVIEKINFFSLKEKYKQIIYGVVFGAFAVLGTHWGIPMNGAQVNCRDASVLIAGLLFGAEAGLIAGAIGGFERLFAGLVFKIGEFTIVACTISTILAGVYAAVLRKFLFENKKPSWLISFITGIVVEVFHLTMVFITNITETTRAMNVVKACSTPMLIANGASVMLAAIAITLLAKDGIKKVKSQTRISQTIQRWLLFTVLLAFFSTSFFVISMQNRIAEEQYNSLLTIALDEVEADIDDAKIKGGDVNAKIQEAARYRNVGETGYIFILDTTKEGNEIIVSAPEDFDLDALQNNSTVVKNPILRKTYEAEINGEKVFCKYDTCEEGQYIIVSVISQEEALKVRNIVLYVNTYMEIMVFAVLFALIYLLITKVVVNKIKIINQSLNKITGGDLGVIVDVRSNEEFASLSDDINSTVDTLKSYIDEASRRIDKELEFAKNIQSSALPSIFPAFPKRKDFDVYALMNPAKEVGGDFYDFYLTGKNTFNFLIADVSGKGIPAAMFMMRAKTELKTLTEAEKGLAEVFTRGNAALCEGNDAGMFVTAWQGSIDLSNGILTYANAGHNPPLVKRNGGKFEYLKTRAGFVLAGMDGVKYKTQELQLNEGDTVYLYTDGVTEATNSNNELYGEERLLNAINSKEFESVKEICDYIKNDVNVFVDKAPQFDDITMVAFKYFGKSSLPSISFEDATINDIPKVTDFIEEELSKIECPMKFVVQLNVAIDEIFSNIVNYAYPSGKKPITVSLKINEDNRTVSIRFVDEGVPYNPVVKDDPDVTLSAEERKIGGLGIFMVKKTMDDMKYKYEDGKNILTIKKKI